MKTQPIKILSLFSLLLVIYSCEKENEIIEKHDEFVINEFNFKDLISNPIFQEGYQKLNYKKSSKNDIYNFTIDSSKIKKVEMNDYTSFNLLIQRPFETPKYFENLLIEERGGNIKVYLIKYNLLSNIESFDEHNTFSFDAATSVIPLSLDSLDLTSKSTGECSPVAQTWCNWGGEPHVAGHACFMANDGRTYLVYVVDENCSETGPGLGNNGGGALSGNETDEPIIISPVDPDGNPVDFPDATIANEINHILGNSLSESQMFWLFDNARQARKIKLFLETHNSAEAEAFAKEVIIAHTLYSFDVNNFNFYNQIFQYYENNREFDEKALEETILTLYTNYVDPPWERSTGLYNNIPSLEYTASRSFTYRGVPITQFRLVNGDVISQGDYGPFESDFKIFYNIQGTTEWFEMPDPSNYQNLSLDFIFDSFWSDVAIPFARYFTPLEDAIILIDGKNFEGVAESRATAGLFVLVDLVPGGKVLKITRKAGHTLSAASPVIKIAIDATTKTQVNLKNQWKNVISTATNARKGNFGEICTDIDFVEKGYDVVHVNRHTTINPIGDNTGIDHIFKNPVTGEYVIVESKFHGTGGLSTLQNGIRQMSNDWISDGSIDIQTDRLFKAVGGDISLYNDIINNGFERVVGYIQANGTINYKYVSLDGIEINTVFNN